MCAVQRSQRCLRRSGKIHLCMGDSNDHTSHLQASHFQGKSSFQSDICGRRSDTTHRTKLLLECTSHLWLPKIQHGNSLKEKPESWQASQRANPPPNLIMFTAGSKCYVCWKDAELTEAQERFKKTFRMKKQKSLWREHALCCGERTVGNEASPLPQLCHLSDNGMGTSPLVLRVSVFSLCKQEMEWTNLHWS